MAEAGYAFTVVEPRPEAECGMCSGELPTELVARLACQKAADVVERIEAGSVDPQAGGRRMVVIGCDTVAECQGQILGKPADERHSQQMLELLSGREHRAYSGLCVWPLPGREPMVRIATTTLRMRTLAASEIRDYLATGLWEGKAGAFGLQDRLGWLSIVAGSESNVVGLPMELLTEMLTAISSE